MTKELRDTTGRVRRLSSQPKALKAKGKENNKYTLKNAGPEVTVSCSKLVATNSLNMAASSTSEARLVSTRPTIETNVQSVHHKSNDASVSDITSTAEQFNLYRFDETSATHSYKKMMNLHLKDEMFRGLKFITNDAELEFSSEENSLCGYVCTWMRVSNYQWGEYWTLVKTSTKKMIENQRTNATSAIKKGFRSKYTMNCFDLSNDLILTMAMLLILSYVTRNKTGQPNACHSELFG